MQLPAEVHNIIYSFLLVVPQAINLSQMGLTYPFIKHFTTILRTGQVVYHEAMPILYGQNQFIFHEDLQTKWFASFTAHKMIRHAVFCIFIFFQKMNNDETSWIYFLKSLKNSFPVLQHLELKFLPASGQVHLKTIKKTKKIVMKNIKIKKVVISEHEEFVGDAAWIRVVQMSYEYIWLYEW